MKRFSILHFEIAVGVSCIIGSRFYFGCEKFDCFIDSHWLAVLQINGLTIMGIPFGKLNIRFPKMNISITSDTYGWRWVRECEDKNVCNALFLFILFNSSLSLYRLFFFFWNSILLRMFMVWMWCCCMNYVSIRCRYSNFVDLLYHITQRDVQCSIEQTTHYAVLTHILV